jgi:hypothetical protein
MNSNAELDELVFAIIKLARELREGYNGHDGEVLALISKTQLALQRKLSVMGPWETELLKAANSAVRGNFLKLALVSLMDAIEVIELSPAEYKAGYEYNNADAKAIS